MCISLFVRGLPAIPAFNTLHADLPHRIAAIDDVYDYGAFIAVTESVLQQLQVAWFVWYWTH